MDRRNNKYNEPPRVPKEQIPEEKKDQAVALKYDKADGAPKVIAKGSGYLADRILDIAENENIPVYEDEQLADNLSKLDLGDAIPPELFEIVAHIYAFVDRVDAVLDAERGDKKTRKKINE